MVSRKLLAPSPRVIRPAPSITVTSPTLRVLNLTLTNWNLLKLSWISSSTGSRQVLHHAYLGPARLPAANLKLVHEGLNQKESAARLPQQIFFRQRIGDCLHFKPFPFIGDHNGQPVRRAGHGHMHLLARVVTIPVHHGIHHTLPH